MLNADILWFGPNLHNAIARQRIYSSLKKHCGEETERFNVFGMIHNAPRRDEFIFFVGKNACKTLKTTAAIAKASNVKKCLLAKWNL